MLFIITFIFVILIITTLIDIRTVYLYTGYYFIGKTIVFKQFPAVLELLKDANTNAIASIIFPKAQMRFKIIKRQNENEWWLELQVSNRKRKIFDEVYALYFTHKPKKIMNGKIIYYLGYDVSKIFFFLSELFIKNLGIKETSKISVEYKNTRIMKSINEYIMEYSEF